MTKYCSENEKMKRDYAFFLEAANGKQSATIDAALRAIERFEISTNSKPFRKFSVEQARSFRIRLREEIGAGGKPLSGATIATTLKHLRNFFLWLSREPGFRKAINANDANFFSPSEQDLRIASARREKRVATVEEIKHVLALMPAETAIEKRDRALVAFTILTGARDGALASFRPETSGPESANALSGWSRCPHQAPKDLHVGLLPSRRGAAGDRRGLRGVPDQGARFRPGRSAFSGAAHGPRCELQLRGVGLSKRPWAGAGPIRDIFRKAFEAAGLPYAKPHSFRDTLARLGERLSRTREEWKAWSQNLGHESEATTYVSYGEVPHHRQGKSCKPGQAAP